MLPCNYHVVVQKDEERHRDGVLKSTQTREDINVKTNIQSPVSTLWKDVGMDEGLIFTYLHFNYVPL